MKIYKAKASDYDSVKADSIASYIQRYAYKIYHAVNENAEEMKSSSDTKANQKLIDANRVQLKAIASELETVCKRLELIMNGRY